VLEHGFLRELELGERDLDLVLDALDKLDIALRHDRDCHTTTSGTRGTTNTMHIVVRAPGTVPVDDHGDLGDIETTGPHVGGHEHGDLARAELGQTLETLRLREVRVQRHRRDVELVKQQVQEVGSRAPLCEDDRGRDRRLLLLFLVVVALALLRPLLPLLALRLAPVALVRQHRVDHALGRQAQRGVNVLGRVQEEVVQVRIADLGRDEDVLLLEALDSEGAGMLVTSSMGYVETSERELLAGDESVTTRNRPFETRD